MKHITNTISRIFDKLANKKFPKPIQNYINATYVKKLNIPMEEFKHSSEYETLNQLFTRRLIKPRPISNNDKIISPTDSLITAYGKIQEGLVLQIKGMNYSIENLFTKNFSKEEIYKLFNGHYMNFYLSPRDYHNYHCPLDIKVTKVVHVPGKLYPVNKKYLNKMPNLFIENERVILKGITKDNKSIYMVMVGALNVGKMEVDFEPQIQTNLTPNDIKVYEYDNLQLKKGDCMGRFKMGSTVVMFWEEGLGVPKPLLDKNVKFSQEITN